MHVDDGVLLWIYVDKDKDGEDYAYGIKFHNGFVVGVVDW